jgi:RecJ-like exonuclease
MNTDIISEYDAAQLMKLSPTFLRWCTSYAPKGDGIKLQVSKIVDGVYYYDKSELIKFNSHLSTPWVKPEKGQRPKIPSGIKNEIKGEAQYRCPICNTNAGEIAHIKPVSKNLNNHPHNLIFLCPNHHTVYDYGFKYNNIDEKTVCHYKKILQTFQGMCWDQQKNVIESYLSLITKIGKLHEIEDEILACITQPEFEALLKKILTKINVTKKLEKTKGSNDDLIDKIVKNVKPDKSSSTKEKAYSYLDIKEQCDNTLQKDSKLKQCPLCEAKGFTDYFNLCPVCHGECYIGSKSDIDLSLFDVKKCPLCEGDGYTDDFETCPPCGGDGLLTCEQIARIDFSDYEFKRCPLCKGEGHTDEFETCPPCGGDGRLTREQIARIDFSDFEFIRCPHCKGEGHTDEFETCPPCGGDGRMTREQLARIDFSDFEFKRCPLCKGEGHTDEFETCPPCGGDGRLTREQIASIDFSDFEFKSCPLCKGKGHTDEFETCPPCGGDGRITREQLACIDFSDFEFKSCPLCKGEGHTDEFETCPPCRGEGRLTRWQIQHIDFSEFE